VFAGGFEDRLGAVDVVLGDFRRLLDTRSNARLGGLMVDNVDVFDYLVDELLVRG